MVELRAPSSDLSSFIENYWFVTPDAGPVNLRVDVFVDARPDLIFVYGSPYTRRVIGAPAVEHATSNLDAQRLVPIRITQRGHVHIVGVRFRLGGLGPFAQGDLRPFTNKTPRPAEVLGPEIDALEAALASAPPDPAAAALDDWFRARRVDHPARAAFERALGALLASGGRMTMAAVADHAGASLRQVDRWFASHVGIPPKTVARVLRFQAAMRRLMRDPGCSLAEVAAACGYFDQAHFIREFRRMSGGVPSGYRGYYPSQGPYDFAPNVVAFVQDPEGRDG